MVEEIDKKVKGALSKIADYAPWVFALTIVVLVVIAVTQDSPPQRVVRPPDTRTLQYWKSEAKLRIQIDRNLVEIKELLARLADEMDKEDYDAEELLAQIRQRRAEVQRLMDELLNLRRKIALRSGGDYAKARKIWDEG